MKMTQKILPFLLILLSGCGTAPDYLIIIEEMGNRYAPDPRDGVYDVTAERTGRGRITLRGEMDDSLVRDMLAEALVSAGYEVTDSITMLPAGLTHRVALVNVSTATIRARPSHRAELVTQALTGTPVSLLKEERGWVYIRTPDRYLGWCEKASLTFYSDQETEKWRESDRLIVTAPFGFINDVASGDVVSDYVMGCLLENRYETEGGFVGGLPDGREGFIPAGHVAGFDAWRNSSLTGGEQVVRTALSMNGIPYLWGGTSIKGFDCSGYTRIVYFMNGIILARDASLQARHGEEVEVGSGWEVFEPGDLLFFRSSPEGPSGSPVTHVAIYTGDSRYIHAAGMVTVNSLDSTRPDYSAYRAATLQSARRIIGREGSDGIIPVRAHPWY